jgi:hypothetical protein
MAKRVLVTFSGARYHVPTERTVQNARKFGATHVTVYDDKWLLDQADYVKDAKWLLEHPKMRGVGWFAWKPYVLLHALQTCGPADTVLYIDGDTTPVADLTPLFDIGQRDDIMLFRANGWPRADVWTKGECFRKMKMDEEKYWGAQCACARFLVLTPSVLVLTMLWEWYRLCLLPECNTYDLDPGVVQRKGFREHRCEQAILGLLAKKRGHRLYREACQWGEVDCEAPYSDATPEFQAEHSAALKRDCALDRDLYPQLFEHEFGHTYAPGLGPNSPNTGSYFRNV